MANISNINTQPIAIWVFKSPCDVPFDVEHHILIPGEEAVCAYKTTRDVAIFTDKRLIIRDAKGLTGNKVEITTLPYSSILMYSTETAGGLMSVGTDINMWTVLGCYRITLGSDVDLWEFDRLIAKCILGKF